MEELVEDYRDQLLLGAAESASRFGDLREIAVHDVIDSLNRRRGVMSGRPSSVAQVALRLYFIMGLIVGGTALLIALVSQEVPVLGGNLPPRVLLVTSLAGFLLSALVYLMVNTMSRRGYEYLPWRRGSYLRTVDHGEYLMLWGDIELALRRAVAAEFGESTASAPMSALLDSAIRLLPAEDARRLGRLLDLRNRIAHGDPGSVGESEVALALREAERLRDRLQSLAR